MTHGGTYARFWKCALQVNPSSYSRQYQGHQDHACPREYARDLLRTCNQQQIQVVGLADHGNVHDSEAVRSILTTSGITVFPGFELSTSEKIHWICLFSEDTSEQELERYLGKLDCTIPSDGVRHSSLSGSQLLEIIQQLNGFCFAAHATLNSGVLRRKLSNIWKNPRLLAAQIPGDLRDLPEKYLSIEENVNPDYRRQFPVALINAKDVSKPSHLENSQAVTFIKMTRPTFSAFVLAFKDPSARIRLSIEPTACPHSQFDSISISGGFFDGLRAVLSGNLNTVIGGRGAGKSTFLECLMYALDVPREATDSMDILEANLGHGSRIAVKLRSASNQGNRYTVTRRFGEPPRVFDDENNESSFHPYRDLVPSLEFYGQNEIYKLSETRASWSQLIARFIPTYDDLVADLQEQYAVLRANSQRLVNAYHQKSEIEDKLSDLPVLRERRQQFKTLGLDDQLDLIPKFEKERALMRRVRSELCHVEDGLDRLADLAPDCVFLSDPVLVELPHCETLTKTRHSLESLAKVVDYSLKCMKDRTEEASEEISKLEDHINRELRLSERNLEQDLAQLPSSKGMNKLAMKQQYQAILREIEQARPLQAQLRNVKLLIDDLGSQRTEIMSQILYLRNERLDKKHKALELINHQLAGKVRVTIDTTGINQELTDFLLGLDGIGPKSCESITTTPNLSISRLTDSIRKGSDEIQRMNSEIRPSLARILANMGRQKLYELECIDIEECLDIELNIARNGTNYRTLRYLSKGQQCTAILHLLLLSNQDPLVIDQPEDNLDNAFIAERIVEHIRSAKEHRQFLFATHNANIPVFGDAEWIGVCSASRERGEIPTSMQGSIDDPAICDAVTTILEGGKDAFLQRKEKYGFPEI